MTAQHRPTPPHSAAPRRMTRGVRSLATGGRAGSGHPVLARTRLLPGQVLPAAMMLAPANDNRPSLRWRLTRLAASLGILTVGSAIVVMFDS